MKTTRNWMICLLLLAYVGQSLAAVVSPCAMMAPNDAGALAVDAGMDHSGHRMSAGAIADVTADAGSCCDGGLCSMSQCQSAAALVPTLFTVSSTMVLLIAEVQNTTTPIAPSGSPYRPPISR
jgi:hypothetical protein